MISNGNGNGNGDRVARLFAAGCVIDGVRIATLHGTIDYDERDILREALLPQGEPVLPVVADMGGVTFLDSSGINVLVAVHQRVSEAGRWLRIAAPTANVRRVLSMIGIDTVISCHPTLDDALNA